MECKEIRKIVKYRHRITASDDLQMADHSRNCLACHDLIRLDRLASILIGARHKATDEQQGQNPFLLGRIMSRIQGMREQNLTSWETAVSAMRGWLAAFATAAIILITISIQWNQPKTMSDVEHETDELNIQNPAEYLISDVLDSTSEDHPYAYK